MIKYPLKTYGSFKDKKDAEKILKKIKKVKNAWISEELVGDKIRYIVYSSNED